MGLRHSPPGTSPGVFRTPQDKASNRQRFERGKYSPRLRRLLSFRAPEEQLLPPVNLPSWLIFERRWYTAVVGSRDTHAASSSRNFSLLLLLLLAVRVLLLVVVVMLVVVVVHPEALTSDQ